MTKNVWIDACLDESNCCMSCHEDWDMFGDNLMECYIQDGDTCYVFTQCCYQKDLTKADQIKLLEKYQEEKNVD